MRHAHCLPCALDAHDSAADETDTRAALSDREIDRLAAAMLALEHPHPSDRPVSVWEIVAGRAGLAG